MQNVNEVKLSGRVISVRDTAKGRMIRIMPRNKYNGTLFFDVFTSKDVNVEKDQNVLVRGSLACMEKTEKYAERYYMHGEEVAPYTSDEAPF